VWNKYVREIGASEEPIVRPHGFVPCDHITCPDAIFDNLGGARARLRKGIGVSDAIKRSLENTKANQKTSAWLEARTDANPPIHPRVCIDQAAGFREWSEI